MFPFFHLQGGMADYISIAFGGFLQILDVVVCESNPADFQIAADLGFAQPQIICRNDHKALPDVQGHEPGRNRAAAD